MGAGPQAEEQIVLCSPAAGAANRQIRFDREFQFTVLTDALPGATTLAFDLSVKDRDSNWVHACRCTLTPTAPTFDGSLLFESNDGTGIVGTLDISIQSNRAKGLDSQKAASAQVS